jgi:hypothetical protein
VNTEELNQPRINVKMNIDIEPDFTSIKPLTASTTGRNGSKSLSRGIRPGSSSQFFSPTTTNTPGGTRPISRQYQRKAGDGKINLDEDEEDYETAEYQFTNLRTEIIKLLGGQEMKPKRMIKSASGASGPNKRPTSISGPTQPVTDFTVRPSTVTGARKIGIDVIQSVYAQRRPLKYQLKKFNDIFEESSFENGDGLEEHLLKNELIKMRQNDAPE